MQRTEQNVAVQRKYTIIGDHHDLFSLETMGDVFAGLGEDTVFYINGIAVFI